MSRWHKWAGGPMPVAPESLVRPQIRVVTRAWAADRTPTPAKGWRWSHKGEAGDIVAYEHMGEVAA